MKFVIVFALFALVAGKPTLPSLPQLEAILDAINNRPVAGPAIIDYEPVVVGPDMIDFDLEHESAIAEDTVEGLLRKLRDILERIKPVAQDKIKYLKDKVREVLDLLPERPVPVVDDYQTVVIGPALVDFEVDPESAIAEDTVEGLLRKLRDILERIKPVAQDKIKYLKDKVREVLDLLPERPVPVVDDYQTVVIGPALVDFEVDPESAIAEDTVEGLLRKLRDILERIKPVAQDKIKYLKDKVREVLDLLPERPVPVVDDYQTVVIGPALVDFEVDPESAIAEDTVEGLLRKLRDILERIKPVAQDKIKYLKDKVREVLDLLPERPVPVVDDYQTVVIGPALVDFEVDPESAIANDTLDALLQKIRALIQKLKDRITRPVEIVDAPEDDSAIDSIIIPVPASSTLVQIIVNVKNADDVTSPVVVEGLNKPELIPVV